LPDELGFALKARRLPVRRSGPCWIARTISRTAASCAAILRERGAHRGCGIFVLVVRQQPADRLYRVDCWPVGVRLVAFDDSGISAEAAMKYFVLGAIAPGACCTGFR